MQKTIVETAFQAESPSGRRRNIVVKIGQPVQAKTRDWVCPVQIFGFQKKIKACGEDALQALCLGIHLVGDLLSELCRKGFRVRFIDSEEEVPLYAYFRVNAMRKRMEKLGWEKVSIHRKDR